MDADGDFHSKYEDLSCERTQQIYLDKSDGMVISQNPYETNPAYPAVNTIKKWNKSMMSPGIFADVHVTTARKCPSNPKPSSKRFAIGSVESSLQQSSLQSPNQLQPQKDATRTKVHTASGLMDVSQFSSGSSQHGSTDRYQFLNLLTFSSFGLETGGVDCKVKRGCSSAVSK